MAACRRSTSPCGGPSGRVARADSRIPRASMTCVFPRARPGLMDLPVRITDPNARLPWNSSVEEVEIALRRGIDDAGVPQNEPEDEEDDETRDAQPHQP